MLEICTRELDAWTPIQTETRVLDRLRQSRRCVLIALLQHFEVLRTTLLHMAASFG